MGLLFHGLWILAAVLISRQARARKAQRREDIQLNKESQELQEACDAGQISREEYETAREWIINEEHTT